MDFTGVYTHHWRTRPIFQGIYLKKYACKDFLLKVINFRCMHYTMEALILLPVRETNFFFFCLFFFLGPLPRRMEVPRLGVQLKLQPLAYTRATAMPDPSRVCDLHHSSQQRRILNILSKARDRTGNLMVPSRIC